MSIKLRPHHLLCTQGYSGKGYDKEFVKHMTEVVTKLRQSEPVEIELVLNTDELCKKCPHKLGEDCCDTNEKVKTFDSKVVEYFGLKEGHYIYQDLIQRIDKEMTEAKLEDICKGCSWYPISACKKNIIGIDKG